MNSDIKVFNPSGILNTVSGNQLRRDVGDIISSGINIVLIDLQNVEFIDSSGLGALVATMQTVKAAGGKLFVCSANEQVKMLFKLTKMERIFKILLNPNELKNECVAEDFKGEEIVN